MSVRAAHSPGEAQRPSPAWPVDPTGRRVRVGQAVITAALIVIAIVRATSDGARLPWTLAGSVIFGCWYSAGLLYARRGRGRDRVLAGWWLVTLALIWAGLMSLSAEFVWLAFPLWLLAGLILPLRWALALSAAVLAGVVLAPLLHDGSVDFASVIGPAVGSVFALGASRAYLRLVHDVAERRRLIASLHRAQQDTLALQDELLRVHRDAGATAERTRLSRDIHDTVAQSVSSIGMLARAALHTGSPEHLERALEQIDQLARDGLTDIRRIVNALMPAELEEVALPAALRTMLARLAAETGIDTDLYVDDTLPALPTAVEVALLRTAQSALANTRTHAQAHRVVVTLTDATDTIRLDITDDGQGFDAARWDNPSNTLPGGSGYGLWAMRQRLRELGGGLDVESAPGEGTALSAHLPLGPSLTDQSPPDTTRRSL